MLDWVREHSSVIALVVNILMLGVWMTYLQVFVRGYSRQTRPKIVINRGAGSALTARCFISNMSSEPIYVESIVAILEADGQRWSAAVTDVETLDGFAMPEDPKKQTYQGPLQRGDYMEIGSFRSLIDRVLRKADLSGIAELDRMSENITAEIQVYADYASEDLLIGAQRRFTITWDNGAWRLHPEQLDTGQIRSRRQRRYIQERLREHL